MKIERIVLRLLRMPLVHFFETSFSRTYERQIVIVEVVSEGLSGWGEITAGEHPFYNEEWSEAAWIVARDYVAPRVIGREIGGYRQGDVYALSAHIRGHNMARGGVEAAVWDLQARCNGNPLWKEIGGGARREIPCGVSIGIQDSVEQLITPEKIEIEARGRVSADQDEDQAGLGCGCDPADSPTLPFDPVDGGREFGVHAGGCGAVEAAG